MADTVASTVRSAPPFDHARLDALLEQAELDAVVATSPHNVSYLLGGYEFFMYALADSIGIGRYLPAVAYRRGAPEETMYVGAGNEDWGTDVTPLWVSDLRNLSWGAIDTAEQIVRWREDSLGTRARIGVELPYLPADAQAALDARGLETTDATVLLESLRAVKRPHELALVRDSSTAVVDAILATIATTRTCDTKADILERLRRAETERGLTYRYGLVATGADFNRGPSERRVEPGDILSLDSGATYQGWVADLTRMGIHGDPTARHDELLAQVDHVQQAARRLAVAGIRGGDLFDAAAAAIAECDDRERLSFLAHGTGLVTHEAPRLTATGSPPYPAAHAELPLEAGMVLSIESQVADPEIGFVKLEDTVIVGATEPEPVADHGRGWNRIEG
jgi:Xaa-Pro aminopeptidase